MIALHTTLARAGIRLEMRGVDAVVETPECQRVADNDQPIGCERCVLADDRDATDEVLAKIKAELDRYPTEMLVQADIGSFALCRSIEQPATREQSRGFAGAETRRVMIAASDPELEAAVHHELFHMIESARIARMDDDPEWQMTNPTGFSYGEADFSRSRPAGFVLWYGTTNISEDRATVYHYMMAWPDELCAIATADPIVRAKAQIIWSRIITYARGGDLMDRAAPCVRALAAPQPNPQWLQQRLRRALPGLTAPDRTGSP